MEYISLNDLKNIIKEELNRSDVKSMINNRLSEYLKEKEFEDKIRDIVSDVFENYFKYMYTKRIMWKNDIKRQ